jgi:hypothetical protein
MQRVEDLLKVGTNLRHNKYWTGLHILINLRFFEQIYPHDLILYRTSV